MPRSASRCRKRAFQGNQFSRQKEKSPKYARKSPKVKDDGAHAKPSGSNQPLSASLNKLRPSTEENEPKVRKFSEKLPEASGYCFMDMKKLATAIELVCCKDCGKCSMTLRELSSKRKGCASCLQFFCASCGWSYSFYTSKKEKKFFDVNRRLVYGMRTIGRGASAAKRFCAVMNMPPPPAPNAYHRHNVFLMKAAKKVAENTMQTAAREVHQLTGACSSEEYTNCGVSCDGTWQRRGHSSMNGCVTVLSMDTGKCLDVEVLSKVCHGCQRHENQEDSHEKRLWRAEHQGKCKANYRGSAPAMETEGVKRIFERSEEKHKLRYTQYFGDGDSKGFSKVKNTYRDKGLTVVKKECVGHVQKRVGTALRKLKKEKKGLGGRGQLTDAMIDRLQNYYGIAIRSNVGDLDKMKKAIYASLFHCASSERRNLHSYCPEGSDSWCRFNRDRANQTSLYKPGPGLPDQVIAEVKPVFKRLSEDSLLEKCLDGKTQNQNESLNGMIWERVPKDVFIGFEAMQLGVYHAVANFNIGGQASVNILSEVGMEPGEFCLDASRKEDNLRVMKGNYKETTRQLQDSQSSTQAERRCCTGE